MQTAFWMRCGHWSSCASPSTLLPATTRRRCLILRRKRPSSTTCSASASRLSSSRAWKLSAFLQVSGCCYSAATPAFLPLPSSSFLFLPLPSSSFLFLPLPSSFSLLVALAFDLPFLCCICVCGCPWHADMTQDSLLALLGSHGCTASANLFTKFNPGDARRSGMAKLQFGTEEAVVEVRGTQELLCAQHCCTSAMCTDGWMVNLTFFFLRFRCQPVHSLLFLLLSLLGAGLFEAAHRTHAPNKRCVLCEAAHSSVSRSTWHHPKTNNKKPSHTHTHTHSLSLSLSLSFTHTHSHTHTHTHTHTHSLSLSLSLCRS